MGVEQTLSKLQVHLMTPESESWFISDHIRPSPNGNGFQVIGVYTNEPNIHLRDERISEMHQGAIIRSSSKRTGRGCDRRSLPRSIGPTARPQERWTSRGALATCSPDSPMPIVRSCLEEARLGEASTRPVPSLVRHPWATRLDIPIDEKALTDGK